MTGFAAYLDSLDAAARAASTAERGWQAEAARRAAELKVERAFAWRRLNLVRAVAAAVRAAEDEPTALAAGRAAMLREVGWTGATEAQRQVAEAFAPVVVAVRAATAEEGGADPAAALAGFEAWYAEARGAPFLALMDREPLDLPLVEV
jgi:hypothetical protein